MELHKHFTRVLRNKPSARVDDEELFLLGKLKEHQKTAEEELALLERLGFKANETSSKSVS